MDFAWLCETCLIVNFVLEIMCDYEYNSNRKLNIVTVFIINQQKCILYHKKNHMFETR